MNAKKPPKRKLDDELPPCPQGHSRYWFEAGLGFVNDCVTCARIALGEVKAR